MRGRSLWRDPPVASACAFCANRIGAPRPRLPSHVQRRFLQTTRPTARPPATAAAVREEQDDGSDFSNQSTTWGNRPTIPAGGSWGGPSFGRSIASPLGSTSTGFGRPTFGSATVELTKEEQEAAARLKQEVERGDPRPITVFSGPGPETHRGGRPEPFTRRPENASRAMARDKHNGYVSNFIENGQTDLKPEPQGRLESHRVEQPSFSIRYEGRPTSQIRSESVGWGSLRRRNTETSTDTPKAQFDTFARDRAEREEKAKSATYTPLTSNSAFGLSQKQDDSIAFPTLRGEVTPSVGPVLKGLNGATFLSGSSESTVKGQNATPRLRQEGGRNGMTSPRGEYASDKAAGMAYKPKSFGLPGIRSGQGVDNGFGLAAFESKKTEIHEDERKVRDQSIGRFSAASYGAENVAGMAYQPKSFGLPGTRSGLGVDARRESAGHEPFEKRQGLELDREARANKRAEKYAAEELAKSEREAEAPTGRGKDKSRRRHQFVAHYEEVENEDTAAAKAEQRRQRKKAKAAKKAAAPTPVFLPEYITVANLALALRVRLEDFVEKMEELGFEEIGYDFILNSENAGLIAQEYNFEPIIDRSESLDLKARPAPEDPSILPPRAPVVTIMGHVDHGKTTLLDYLRKSSVAATEHGGITQHIGAFSVPMPSGKVITFLDTPGHAAFLNMRQRGAHVTDIVILVVAADDSVKPQTIEAIKHAKAAQVPMIVAINKVDKEEANIERVKQDLARHGVEIEDYGGDTQVVCVSGKTGQGMTELEEAAVTLTEILDMRADIDGPAEGWVLEASIKSMGKVATVLVRRGTMRPGDFIVAGNTWARIRCLRNEAGVDIEEAGPGTPVEIDGWKEQPIAGDEVLQAPSEQKAKSVVDYRNERDEREKLAEDMEAINDTRKFEQEKREAEKQEKLLAEASKLGGEELIPATKNEAPKGAKQVYFIIKGDVSGSVEAVVDSISAISTREVQAHILRSGVGQISEFDIEHAAAANGYVINFNTAIDPKISSLAEASKVQIIDQNIIYRLMDEVKAKMSEFLPALVTHKVLGEAEVAQVFQINIKGRQTKAMAGCKVRNGIVSKNAKVRVLRGGEKIFDGILSSLKHIKKDVPEMRKGSECGMGFEDWTDFQVGDQIQSYEMTEEKRYL